MDIYWLDVVPGVNIGFDKLYTFIGAGSTLLAKNYIILILS